MIAQQPDKAIGQTFFSEFIFLCQQAQHSKFD